MKKYALFLIPLLLLSCQKDDKFVELKSADWYISDYLSTAYSSGIDVYIDTSYVHHEDLINEKIISITSHSEFMAFTEYIPGLRIGSQSIYAAFGDTDFNEYTFYVLQLKYLSANGGRMTRSNILVRESTQEISFDFKWKILTSSGLGEISQFVFFKIPKSYAQYAFSGKIYFDENNKGSNPDDYTKNYGF